MNLFEFWYRNRLRFFVTGLLLILATDELITIFIQPVFTFPLTEYFLILFLMFVASLLLNRRAMKLTLAYTSMRGSLKVEKNPLARFLLSRLRRKEDLQYFTGAVLITLFISLEMFSRLESTAIISGLALVSICALDAVNDELVVRRYQRQNKT